MSPNNKTSKQQVLPLPSASIWNDIAKSDKYNIEGWNISTTKSPSLDSSTNNSKHYNSDDSDMKGKYSYLRLGGPDKYDVSFILNYSSSMSSLVDFKGFVQHYGHDHSNISTIESISRCKPLHKRYDARDDDDDDDDDDNHDGGGDEQVRKYFKGDLHCNSDSSTDSSSYHEPKFTVVSRREGGLTSIRQNNNREENYIDNTVRSSNYYHYISPSTTVSVTQNSVISDHYSSGTMLTESSITLISDIYDGDNEHSGTDGNLRDVHTYDSKVSSMSYSSTTYSSLGDDYSKSRPLYTDQMGLLFAETLVDDAIYDDGHKHDESYENGDICSSDVCVDAIVDLPWIFDELEEECHDEWGNFKKEMIVITEKIKNCTSPISNKLETASITKHSTKAMSVHQYPAEYEDYANVNATDNAEEHYEQTY